MKFKDFELSKELSSDQQAAVRGGAATNAVSTLVAGTCPVIIGGGIPVDPPIYPLPDIPSIVPTTTNPDPKLILASLVASAHALLGQPTLQSW